MLRLHSAKKRKTVQLPIFSKDTLNRWQLTSQSLASATTPPIGLAENAGDLFTAT